MFSAWEMNLSLADELKGLRSRLGTEAAEERAKIVTWLKMVKDEYSDSYVAELPDRVEAGEHLK